jgi:membrane protein required for colicin V production
MNAIDIILVIILFLALVRGFTRGFLVEIFSLLAVVVGIFAAYYGSGWVTEKIITWRDWGANQVNLISFIFIFVLVVFLVNLIGKLITKFAELIMLGLLNRILGAFLNLATTVLILSVLLNVLSWFSGIIAYEGPFNTSKSQLYNPIKKIVPEAYQIWKENYSPVQEEELLDEQV